MACVRNVAHGTVIMVPVETAMFILFIFQKIAAALNNSSGNTRFLQSLHNLLGSVLLCPRRDCNIYVVMIFQSISMCWR